MKYIVYSTASVLIFLWTNISQADVILNTLRNPYFLSFVHIVSFGFQASYPRNISEETRQALWGPHSIYVLSQQGSEKTLGMNLYPKFRNSIAVSLK